MTNEAPVPKDERRWAITIGGITLLNDDGSTAAVLNPLVNYYNLKAKHVYAFEELIGSKEWIEAEQAFAEKAVPLLQKFGEVAAIGSGKMTEEDRQLAKTIVSRTLAGG